MGQTIPYAHQVSMTQDDLVRVVTELMAERPRHQHNFEVWVDEGTILLNESGVACVARILDLDAVPRGVVAPHHPEDDDQTDRSR